MNKKSSIYCLFQVIFLGMITKVISMSSRIVLSRSLGIEAVSIYSLVNPIFVFLLTIGTFSLPTAISALIAKNPNQTKKIFITSLFITLFLNLIIVLCLFLGADYIANSLLHNSETLSSIYLLCIVIPLTSISSLVKGFYLGKKEIVLTSSSSLVEECSRFISVICLVGLFQSTTNEVKATFFVLVMIIGEIIQTTYLIFTSGTQYLKKATKLGAFFEKDTYIFPPVIKVSAPLTLSRIITSFTFMLEPIILSFFMIKQNGNQANFTLEYGVLSSYVFPMLFLPGFFSLAIGNYLLPHLSSLIGKKKYIKAESLFHQILLYTFIIGSMFSLMFFFFGDKLLTLVYRIDYGKQELHLLAIPFLIYYVETPINMSLNALCLSKTAFKTSLFSSIFRIIILIICIPYFKVFSVAISTLASVYLNVLLNYLAIHQFFKRQKIESIN